MAKTTKPKSVKTVRSGKAVEQQVKQEAPRADIYIIPERCKGCGFCIRFCPKHALEFAEKSNVKGYRYPEVVKPGECGACMMCEYLCPDFAIYVKPKRKKKKNDTDEENK